MKMERSAPVEFDAAEFFKRPSVLTRLICIVSMYYFIKLQEYLSGVGHFSICFVCPTKTFCRVPDPPGWKIENEIVMLSTKSSLPSVCFK